MKHLKKTIATLRKHALAYPESFEDHPWGEVAFKVKGKMFFVCYLHEKDRYLNVTIKLPVSGKTALTLPFANPTGYGLGKSGWVTCRFDAGDEVPIDMLIEWMDESYRAVAPKRVVAQLEDDGESPPVKARRKKNA